MITNEVFFCDGKCLDDWKKLEHEGYDDHFCKVYRNDGIMIVDGKRVYCSSWTLVTDKLPVDKELVIAANGKVMGMAKFYLFTRPGEKKPGSEFRNLNGDLLTTVTKWMKAPGHNVTGYLDEEV